jgi:hypothetical protein
MAIPFDVEAISRRRCLVKLLVLVVVAATSAVLGVTSAAAGDPATPSREPVLVEFTLPDMCAFPVVVRVEGWQILTPVGIVVRTTSTLSNENGTRSLTQENVYTAGDNGYTVVEKIVTAGNGVVGTMGHTNGSGFHGHDDPYWQYAAVVCGYLGDG